jgi:hypothetical protein
MTARELIEKLQSFGEEHLNKPVLVYDEYRYVNINTVEIIEEYDIYNEEQNFIGID